MLATWLAVAIVLGAIAAAQAPEYDLHASDYRNWVRSVPPSLRENREAVLAIRRLAEHRALTASERGSIIGRWMP